jgi:hypothetical protein
MSTHPSDGQQPVNLRPNLAVVPHPEERAPAARLRRGLNRVMRSRRVLGFLFRRAALRVLVIEQIIIGGQREPGTTSYAENLIRAIGKAAGDHVLGKTQHTLNQLARKADGLRAEQGSLRIRAGYVAGDYVAHPDGGVRTVTDTASDLDHQRAQIAADIEHGSRRHRRLPKALRRVPILVFAADALLLLYFFSGVTNVDWASPFSAALVFAVLLAAMVTGISFAFFRFAGDRLQQYKNDAGTVPLRGLDEATTVAAFLALAAMAVLAVLMFTRMHAEVIIALGPHSGVTAIIIGLTLAMISVLANTLVIAVHALDGSTEADRLDALGDAIADKLNMERRLLERADSRDKAIAVLGREADRKAAEGITEAGHQRAAADRLIDAGRASHQGTGPLSEPAVDPNSQHGVVGYRRPDANPEVDERPVRLALDHIHTPQTDKQLPAGEQPGSGQDPAADKERPAA